MVDNQRSSSRSRRAAPVSSKPQYQQPEYQQPQYQPQYQQGGGAVGGMGTLQRFPRWRIRRAIVTGAGFGIG